MTTMRQREKEVEKPQIVAAYECISFTDLLVFAGRYQMATKISTFWIYNNKFINVHILYK